MGDRRRKKPAPPPPPPPPPPRYEREFFDGEGVSTWMLDRHNADAPSSVNGYVRVRRHRIIVEVIDEPIEVIRERLLKLWRETDNHHHMQPLKVAAKRYGIELPQDECGVWRRLK